jgi:N-acetylneuraminic acid mutarotase
MDFRPLLAATATAALLVLSACGGGGSGSQNPPAPVTYTSSGGVAEKGPLITGSTVTVQELDTSLSPTGKQYSYQVTSDLGAFSPTSTFTSRYVGINATGYYFDEVQGVVSSGPVTLNGYSDLSANSTINVNILTTLATQRIKKLIVDDQMTFADARSQAEREVLTALGIPAGSYEPFGTLDLRGTSEGDRILAAISSVFVNGNQAGQMSALISNVQTDLGNNGRLTNQTTIAALASAASTLNCAAVAANLNQRYAPLGVTFTANDLAAWIDQNGDGLVGKFEFQVADASASSIFSVPADVVNRFAGQAIAATAGEFVINGTPVTTATTVNTGDVLTVSPGSGPFPDGVRTVYLTSGDNKLARVSFVSGLVAITVTPATQDLAKGLTQQFTAIGTFSDTGSLDVTGSVAWTSSAESVAAVGPGGLAQTLAVGSTTIAASSGEISGSAALNVTAAVPISLAISASPLRTGVGLSMIPTLTATYSDGTTAESTALATWASQTPTVATIDPHSGLINGVSLGTTTIEATVDTVTENFPLEVVTNAWTPAGNLVLPRGFQTATLLPSGAVLAIGGNNNTSFDETQFSAEIYNPLKRTWSRVANMRGARGEHTATLLSNGKVLVAGGAEMVPMPMNGVELYDPIANSWSNAPSMSAARKQHTATRLANGKVLVAGGRDSTSSPFASAELYDPLTNTWSPAGSMSTGRSEHTATLLGDGKVLVVGGSSADPPFITATAELYDPTTNTWSAAASLPTAVYFHTATALPDGRVLVAGGATTTSDISSAVVIYDAASNTWSPSGSMARARLGHTATLLPNGKVLVAAGLGQGTDRRVFISDAEIYDPATATWTAASSLSTARYVHQATLLPDGAVLISGGRGNDSALTSSELYW